MCKETITKQVLTIEDKSYHPECLTCDICNRPLKGDFYMDGEKRVCQKDAEVTDNNLFLQLTLINVLILPHFLLNKLYNIYCFILETTR